ncbi:glutathione S-transferase family protein [Neisseria animalis]|uniref:Glutathione S-transferase n=1 Tax=Neisseria animalis TaxID=492 RepID=A0A5P3MUY1_NEIAN|nr:glutathione S-transferase [Neisseria animalis]QEY24885.1 glutathione S-transferase [Neisseria animalis]ROW32415.1 glutathione S-transferase [Neisseria animalis]VEE08090.1 Glutathione S-transferase GST-6.0 [Neisseria animalis]
MLTLHALQQSRAFRIVWLLELLECEYKLVSYPRNPETLLAPETLKTVHPLGKSPILEDGELVLTESTVIAEYLARNYGKHNLLPEYNTPAYWQCRRWADYAESSLMPLMLLSLVFKRVETAPMPFFAKPVARKISSNVKSSFIHPQTELHLAHINETLAKQQWLLGNHITLADVMMSFPIQAAGKRFDLAAYSHILRYIGDMEHNPAYRRAVERSGKPVL